MATPCWDLLGYHRHRIAQDSMKWTTPAMSHSPEMFVQTFRGTSQNVRQSHRTIQNHTEPYRTIQNYTEPYRTIQNHTEPYRTIQNHTEPRINVPSSRNLAPASGQSELSSHIVWVHCVHTWSSCTILSCAALLVVSLSLYQGARFQWLGRTHHDYHVSWVDSLLLWLNCRQHVLLTSTYCSCSHLWPAHCWHSPLVANWKSFQMLLLPSTILDRDDRDRGLIYHDWAIFSLSLIRHWFMSNWFKLQVWIRGARRLS